VQDDIKFNLKPRVEQKTISELFLVHVGGTLVLCVPEVKVTAVYYCYGNNCRQKRLENFRLWLEECTKRLP
jgi:hypothetical protein